MTDSSLDEAAVDAHRWPSISSYPAPGQEGKDIVVLDRWAEDRTEGARAITPGIGIMKVPARVPL